MAHEYLNDTTDAMFREKITISNICIALAFYENVLNRGKFISQRWHFQNKMYEIEYGPSFMKGYFGTRKRELSASLRDKLFPLPLKEKKDKI